MEAKSSNPLISSQKSSQLQAVLHPLILLSITDYFTRHSLRGQKGPLVGALLGQQNGREITIEHAFDCHVREVPEVEGGWLLDADKFSSRLDQMVTVHKERQLDLVGWYTIMPSTGPTSTVLPIHMQIVQGWNESPILLGFDPNGLLDVFPGGKLPLTIYESNLEADDRKLGEQDGDDKKMQDGEAPFRLKFREVPYTVETEETEMISMNYVAAGTGNATSTSAASKDERPARSIESTGKGKRRLVEAEADEAKRKGIDDVNVTLTREEEAMISALTAKANAIKMLHSRIRLLTAYLEHLPPSFTNSAESSSDSGSMDTDHTTPSLPILRQIQALVNRLDLVIPSNKEAFDIEMRQEANNVNVTNLLNSIMQSLNGAREVGKKFSIVEATKAASKRGGTDTAYLASPGFNMPGAGDILI